MSEQTFFTAFSRVKELAEDFQANEKRFLAAKYSEAQVRLDFIDKFWIALGWDVGHEREKNPYEQEVKVERGVSVSNRTKKADYAFFAAPNFRDVKFYVEAKKPSRNLDNADDYFQTIRYGWSSKTPIAVLTDFEQFRVVDCRYKPNIQTAENFALKKFDFREYADEAKFREIYHLFSRESVINGSLEDYAKSLPKRGKGRQKSVAAIQKSVDESFLDDLDTYRDALARAFKNKNAELDGEALTEAVTRTLDRLVFMRFLEDKLIEPDTMIDKFASWADFVRTSKNLNSFYNGIVFKAHLIDSADFNADEKVFASICDELSPKDSPYNFNYIPVHILGSIYERFLGKVIVATDKRAAVQEKPEVRKAGGVYYTPEYIVRYIVENTVGKLIENKTPAEIAELRFADIACGSGSFLLGVYDYLLRYLTDYFNLAGKKGEARTAGCVEYADGSFTLSIAQRREILRNNVFGVDVDAQATEVAQLSLALKLLEDATTATTRAFQPKLGEKLLPDMSKNIVCGNSLVDWDILDGQLFERNEERKLNPMSYEDKFPEVMKRGGFDAIVGNPPYGIITDEVVKDYAIGKFASLEGRFDIYELFIEKAFSLCKSNGLLGYIVPSPLLSNLYTRKLRKFILDNTNVQEITNFKMDVFSDPTVHTCVIVLSRSKNLNQLIKIRKQVIEQTELFNPYDYEILQKHLGANANYTFDIFIDPVTFRLIEKLQTEGISLGEICFIRQCIKTGNDSLYVTKSELSPSNEWKKSLRGKSIGRYSTHEKDIWLKYGDWLARNWKNKSFYETPKIAIRETGNRVIANLDLEERYFLSSLYAIYPINPSDELNLKYLLAIINSNLAMYFLKVIALDLTEGAFTKFRTNQLARLPIRAINFADTDEKAAHDKMVALVGQMLEAKKYLQTARTDKDKNFYQDRCNALDRQIDKLVYWLYNLTDDEILIVEGKS